MAEKIKKILIVGAGRAGTALLKMFKKDPSVEIVGMVDTNPDASGIQLAKEANIPVAEQWNGILKDSGADEIINATGDHKVHEDLMNAKPKKTVLVSELTAKTLWFLAKEYETVEQKIQEAKEDVEAHEWGVKKTNEAIKTLYKELEAKNKELQELDRLKSDFISTVSHELRTPLAITKEGITLIQDGVLGEVNERQQKVLVTAKESIDRLARLIASLLDISKIEAGHHDAKKSLINLTGLVEQVVTFFRSKVEDKGLEIRTKLPEAEIDVFADDDKIMQVLTNLIGNSIRFTEKGYIEISVEEKEDEIECCVQDTGKGVAQQDTEKMFVKFQQIDRVHGDGERGTGLGLSIAKSIIEMHDGHIWAESEENKGTKVFFTIPKYTDDTLLREYVNKGIEEAKKSDTKMSLMVVSIDNYVEAKKSFSDEQLYSVLKNVDEVLKNSIDHSGGAALKDSHECIVILPNSSKQSALSAEGRLKQAVDDYLIRERLADKIKMKFGCATYPDEGSDSEELIKQVLQN